MKEDNEKIEPKTEGKIEEPTKDIETSVTEGQETENSEKQKELVKKHKKIWYKNPWFWVGLAAAIIGVVSITLGLIYRNNVLKTNQAISDGWLDITTQSNQVVVLQSRLAETKDYNGYSIQLHTLDNAVNNRKYASAKLPSWLTNKAQLDRYNNFLNSFSSYTAKSATLSDTPEKITSSDITSLQESSKTASENTNVLKDNTPSLQANMPPEIFNIPQTLQDVSDTILNKQKQSAADKQAAANAAAQDAADKQAATNSVNGFMNGFIAGNASAMRSFMTAGFQNEYNFNQLSPENRQYQYPASFRIITVTKQANGTYIASLNVLYKYTDNSNQYTQGYEYSVISSGGKWLLNNEKQTNSF